jgi:hypothetical protein
MAQSSVFAIEGIIWTYETFDSYSMFTLIGDGSQRSKTLNTSARSRTYTGRYCFRDTVYLSDGVFVCTT